MDEKKPFPEVDRMRAVLDEKARTHGKTELLDNLDSLEKRHASLVDFVALIHEATITDDIEFLGECLDEKERKLFDLPTTILPEKRLLVIKHYLNDIKRIITRPGLYLYDGDLEHLSSLIGEINLDVLDNL